MALSVKQREYFTTTVFCGFGGWTVEFNDARTEDSPSRVYTVWCDEMMLDIHQWTTTGVMRGKS